MHNDAMATLRDGRPEQLPCDFALCFESDSIRPITMVFGDGRVEYWLPDTRPNYGAYIGRRSGFISEHGELLEHAKRVVSRAHSLWRRKSTLISRRRSTQHEHWLKLSVPQSRTTRSATFNWNGTPPVISPARPSDQALFQKLHELLEPLQTCPSTINVAIWTGTTPYQQCTKPHDDARTVLLQLFARPPVDLHTLEFALGNVAFPSEPHDGLGSFCRMAGTAAMARCIQYLSVTYQFDRHHQRPYSLQDGRSERNVTLSKVHVRFAHDGQPKDYKAMQVWVESAARERFGKGDAIAGHGVVFTDAQSHWQICNGLINWYRWRPEFAMPGPVPGARAAFVQALLAQLRSNPHLPDLLQFVGAAPIEAWVSSQSKEYETNCRFSFEPGVDAVELATWLGLVAYGAVSYDVNRVAWHIVEYRGRFDQKPPRVGVWEFRCNVNFSAGPVREFATDMAMIASIKPGHLVDHVTIAKWKPSQLHTGVEIGEL